MPLTVKTAKIDLSAHQLFTYVPLPAALTEKLTGIAKHVVPAGTEAKEQDHVTLAYVPKSETAVDYAKIDTIIHALRAVCDDTKPIHAKIQGWAYFDGAEEDGVKKTALVGLIDAPGLENLHVECKSALQHCGLTVSDRHGFTPHVTFAYLPLGDRVDDLPLIDGEFDIDAIVFANSDKHTIKLLGGQSLGTKAASCIGA